MAFRTQKISQMTPKGSDLEATDLIEVSTIESGSYVTRSITGQELIDAIPVPPSGITIGTTAITSGTVGRVLFQGTGNVVQQSSSLFWDNTNNRLGIGTSTPTSVVQIGSAYNATLLSGLTNPMVLSNLQAASLNYTLAVASNGVNDRGIFLGVRSRGTLSSPTAVSNGDEVFGIIGAGHDGTAPRTRGGIFFRVDGSVSLDNVPTAICFENGSNTRTEKLRITPNGNVLINTTTDAGFRLDVNGTARVQNTTTITKGAANYITLEPSANATSPFLDMFFSGQVSTRISLGTTSSTRVFLFRDLGTALGMGIDCGAIFSNSNAILIGGAEQKVQIAGTTNNYLQFTQAGTANRGTIGYAAGQSYMQIRVNGATDLATGTLSTAFFSTGNVGINTTTDAGFRLDVNGTARLRSSVDIGGDTAAINLYRSSGANGRLGTGYASPSINHVFLTCDVNAKALLIDDSNRVIFSASNDSTISSAHVAINSTTRGFLPPRLTTTQKNAIASPATGLMVYDTTLTRPCFYDGTTWITL